jgi:hypothetical protein
MLQEIDYHELVKPLQELLLRFLAGEWDYPAFQPLFRKALSSYAASIMDRPYWPLDVIADIPAHVREKLNDYCRQALDRLPKEALDRSTRVWIDRVLISNEDGHTAFSFFLPDGASRFGTHAVFYSTCIDDDCFLLSALNGIIPKPSFSYAGLLGALRENANGELASWVYGTEPDNALAIVNRVWSLGDSFKECYHLRQLEQEPAPQGGASYLMLLPRSREWMLLNEYYSGCFTISLHAQRSFIERIASAVDVMPDWGSPRTVD